MRTNYYRLPLHTYTSFLLSPYKPARLKLVQNLALGLNSISDLDVSLHTVAFFVNNNAA